MKTKSLFLFLLFVFFTGKIIRQTEDGRPCLSAFIHDGETYSDCTNTRSPDGLMTNREWCYVDSPKPGSKKWAYCKPVMDYNKVRKYNQNDLKLIAQEIKNVNEDVIVNLKPAKNALAAIMRIKKIQENLLKKIISLKTELSTILQIFMKLEKTKEAWSTQEKLISELTFQIDQKKEHQKEFDEKILHESSSPEHEISKKIEAFESIITKKKTKIFNCKGMMYYEDEEEGDGLLGRYYSNESWLGPYYEQKDSRIDFDWTDSSPRPDIRSNNYSIQWYGFLLIPYTGKFKFHMEADDGIELRLNGEAVLRKGMSSDINPKDDDKDIGTQGNSGMISSSAIYLNGGSKVKIKIRYYHSIYDDIQEEELAFVKLYWSSNEFDTQTIPAKYLYSSNDIPPLKVTDFDTNKSQLRKLYDNELAFLNSDQFLLQDVPIEFHGSTTLKFNKLINEDIRFTINTSTIVYIAVLSMYPNPLPPEFENTGMVMSLLKLEYLENKGTRKLFAKGSATLDIYKRRFLMGNVIIKLNFEGANKKGIPLVLFFGFDSNSNIPLTCTGSFIDVANSLRPNFKACVASSEKEGMKCDAGFNGRFFDEEGGMWSTNNEGIGAWIIVEFKGLFEISEFRYKNKKNPSERNKKLELQFSTGRTLTVPLKNSDEIEIFRIDPIKTSSVKVTITDVYGTINNGGAFSFLGVPCIDNITISKSKETFPANIPEFKFVQSKYDTSKFRPLFEKAERKQISINCRESITNSYKFSGVVIKPGEMVMIQCPESCLTSDSRIYGGNPSYSKDSAICKSAYHSGVLPAEGGMIVMMIGGSQQNLTRLKKNEIQSEDKAYSDITITFEPYEEEDPIILEEGSKIEINDNDEWKFATIKKVNTGKNDQVTGIQIEGKEISPKLISYPNPLIAPCNTHIKKKDCAYSLKTFTSTQPIQIRFIPSQYPLSEEYYSDNGQLYGDQQTKYGWSRVMSDRIIIRTSASKPELETFVEFPPSNNSKFCNKPNPDTVCEPALWTVYTGKGKFKVTLFVGDPLYELIVNFSINGKTMAKSAIVHKNQLRSFTEIVESRDGFLTVSSECSENCENSISKLNVIEIAPLIENNKDDTDTMKEEKTECGESYIKGRCDTGPEVLHCLYDNKNIKSASFCAGVYSLMKITETYHCKSQIGKYKCVRIDYDSDEDCKKYCPNDCRFTKCLY